MYDVFYYATLLQLFSVTELHNINILVWSFILNFSLCLTTEGKAFDVFIRP